MQGKTFVPSFPLLAGLAVLGLGAALLVAAPGRAGGSLTVCGTTTAGKYTHAGRSTTMYAVKAQGISCATAKTWVRRFVAQKPAKRTISTGQIQYVLTGPPGLLCVALDPMSSGIPKFGYSGLCAPATGARTKLITWGPNL